jgi:hypothetical protein
MGSAILTVVDFARRRRSWNYGPPALLVTEAFPWETAPSYRDFKISDIMFRARAYPWLSEAAMRGGGALRYRYGNPNRADDAYSYSPATRRMRRLNEAIMGDAAGTLQSSFDDAEGYNPKVENYTYKFLGERPNGALGQCNDSDRTRCGAATDPGCPFVPGGPQG